MQGKYRVGLSSEADKQLERLDKSVQARIDKNLGMLEGEHPARHLRHGLPFFVSEAGQNRIAFIVDETAGTKTVVFIGNHKQYEKWLNTQ